jgi:hypothetical protein
VVPSALVDLAISLCFEEAYRYCVTYGDFPGLVLYYYGVFVRNEHFLGVEPQPAQVTLAHDYLRRCGRWRLKVSTSELDNDRIDYFDMEAETTREFFLEWQPGNAWWGLIGSTITGHGEIDVSKFRLGSNCRPRTRTSIETVGEVTGMRFDRSELPVFNALLPPHLADLSVFIRFGQLELRGSCVNSEGLGTEEFRWLEALVKGRYLDLDELFRASKEGAEGAIGKGWVFSDGPAKAVTALDKTFRELRTRIRVHLEVIFEHQPL